MKQMKLRGVLMAVAGALTVGAAAPAIADSSSDIIYALMAKGVLTEEEGHQLLDGREKEAAAEKKAMKSAGKLTISEFIDNATVYGDIRVRAEHRDGEDDRTGNSVDEDRDRARYKLTFGVKTKANDFYSDLAFAMGSGGRSDNATFGSGSNGSNSKETLFVKRAMVGWNATDWLTLEAGRVANPLYTTAMVWDGDLTFEGLVEKLKFKAGNADIFFNLTQSQYIGDHKVFSNGSGNREENTILAFQGGAKFPISDNVSAKAALTYTTYTNDDAGGIFTPAVGTSTSNGTNVQGTNDIRTIEIPAEINIKGSGTLSYSVFGDYVKNLDGDDRADAACAANAAICGKGDDDNAWMLGVGIKSGKGKGAWDAKLWYQDVGMYSVDPNAVDSDFMDSRVNMKGVVFKAGYNLRENVVVNLAAGHAKRKESDLSAAGVSTADIGLNLDSYNLYQLDMTYKF